MIDITLPDEEFLLHWWNKNSLEDLFSAVVERAKSIAPEGQDPFPPQKADLARLHFLILHHRFLTSLEFGVGYSTIVFADAHRKNRMDYHQFNGKKRKLRNSHLFEHTSVDTEANWLEHTAKLLPDDYSRGISFHHSDSSIGLWRDQICHYYDKMPDICPDFIYLDGPDPSAVKGSINGVTFNQQERTPMAGDLLRLEAILLPGTAILVDGRTNNARFLARNFSRNWSMNWDRDGDVTLFVLQEEPLGKHNISGKAVFEELK
jgi:hypothetical protein